MSGQKVAAVMMAAGFALLLAAAAIGAPVSKAKPPKTNYLLDGKGGYLIVALGNRLIAK